MLYILANRQKHCHCGLPHFTARARLGRITLDLLLRGCVAVHVQNEKDLTGVKTKKNSRMERAVQAEMTAIMDIQHSPNVFMAICEHIFSRNMSHLDIFAGLIETQSTQYQMFHEL